MAYSYVRYSGNGSTTNYTFSFPTISTDHIKVRVNGTLVTNWSFLNASTVQFVSAPSSGAVIEIRRETPKDSAIVNFTDGSVLLERDLDLLATYDLYLAQETEDDLEDTIKTDSLGRFDANNKRIINVADPVVAQDAATKNWIETTYTSVIQGISSAAASSATASASSATTATTQATNAASSAVNAANSAAAAATALDNFDDRYLGQKATDPSVDNDGAALITGALYYNTTDSAMRVYTGSGWINASSAQVATMKTYIYVATAAQTTFSGNDANSSSLTYVAPYLIVSLNGIELRPVVDYTATSGLSVVLTAAAVAGDELQIQAFSAFNVANIQSANVTYSQGTLGSTSRSVDAKLKEFVSVKDFGAVGDGVANDTAALVLAAAALQNGQALDFGSGTYLISYQGTPYSSVYGNVVMDFLNKRDISLVGSGATIKVVNHNIGTFGGLRFANFKGCKRVHIEGLNFDMTFTGVNTSASYYPFCGAITALDDDAATPDFNTLNSDFLVERCTFKLFHPYGNWATSSNPYAGDPNNGYKLFSIFLSGPYTPSQDQHLCRNATVQDCSWLEGHNGYGIWFWAWNNCRVSGCAVDSWATKHSTGAGAYSGGGVAFIRNIPFWAHGIVVEGNQFRSRPSAERTGDFAGISQFYVQANNMGAAASGKGETVITGNNVINGGGTSNVDECVFFNDFGSLIVSSNNFEGHDGQAASVGATGITFTPGTTGGLGECSLTVSGNVFGAWLHGPGIFFVNGSNTSASARRCRSLVVTDNIQRSGDFFLRMAGYSYSTFEGCPYTVVTGNIIDGTRTSVFPPPSTNNYGIAYAANVSGDVGIISNNVFINKTEAIKTEAAYCSSSADLSRYGNSYYGITTPFNGSNVYPIDKLDVAQIKFPASATASADPNTLDDYEEGTFTPTVVGATSAGAGTYSTQWGSYTKIGRQVTLQLYLVWTAHTGTGAMRIGGLPFTSISATNRGYASCSIGFMSNIALSANNVATAYVLDSGTVIDMAQYPVGGGAGTTVPMDSAGSLMLSVTYFTA